MTQLSPHFSLAEMTTTQVQGIDNTPPAEVLVRLDDTAQRMEAVRALLAHPIIVTSGYRCPLLNKIVRGAKFSDHMSGLAVDFISPGFGPPAQVCRAIEASAIDFDQCILEESWTHLSFKPTFRKMVLTKQGPSYVIGILEKGNIS